MKLRKKMFFYNFIMFIIPLIVSIIVFEVTIFYMNSTFFTNDNRDNYQSNGANEIVTYLNNTDKLTITEFEKLCNSYGFSIYMTNSANQEYFKNTTQEAERNVKFYPTPSIYGVVYQVDSRTIISKIVTIGDEKINAYAISRVDNLPTVSVTVLKIVLFITLIVPFLAVVICNFVVTNKMNLSVTKPLKELTLNANRIRRGDLNKEVEVSDYEELNELCIAFNAMRLQLKENVDKNVLYENNRQELIAGISHDIKTPLTVIQGYAKGLIDGVATDAEKQKRYLEIIYRKSFEMESLLNQLTIFSKLETKSLVFNFEFLNMDNYLSQIIKQIEIDLNNEKLLINYNNRCKGTNAWIDVNQMNRVINNIIINSIKYNDKNIIIINVNCYLDNNLINLTIADNGPGVKEENVNNIFESFYRVDTSRSSKIEGNGLGLSISKYIVEAHGGKISCSSNQGLTIKIELPKGEKHNGEQ